MATISDSGRVIAAEGVSNFGSMLSRLAIPWVATLMLDATPAAMATLLVADLLAGAAAALLLGPTIDRSPKRAAMLACDVARALLLGSVALGAWQGRLTLALLVAAAAAGGVLNTGFELARSAWIAQRVPAGELPRRNAQLSMAGSVAETLAFALGGWLYQALGAALALAVDALSYLGSALLLRGVAEVPRVTSPKPQGSPWQAWRREQGDGWRALVREPRMRAIGVIAALQGLAFSLAGTSYLVYVARDLALPTGVQGLVFATGSLGAFVGAVLAPCLGRRLGPGRAMTLGLALACVGAACLALAQGAGWVAICLLVAHQVVGDGGQSLYEVHDRTLRQTAVEPGWLARVDAGLRGIGQVATLVGAALGGWLGTTHSAHGVLVLSAAAFGAAALWALLKLAPAR